MKPGAWEMNVSELDEQIRITQAILDQGGYTKLGADRLAMLQEQREERLIEEGIINSSPLGREWGDTCA